MQEYERWAVWYANTWVSPTTCRRKSIIRTILLVVVIGLLSLCVASIIAALWVSMDLDSVSSNAGTDLQKKIYWHSSTRD